MINFAICGFGFMGSTHARCLAGRSDARLCAIVDNSLSNLESADREGNLSMKASEVRLDGGFAFHTRLPFEARFLARFKRATVAFDSARPGVLNIADQHDCKSMTLEEDPLGGYRREIEYFIQCVRKQCWPDECNPESSLEAVELALSHLPKK